MFDHMGDDQFQKELETALELITLGLGSKGISVEAGAAACMMVAVFSSKAKGFSKEKLGAILELTYAIGPSPADLKRGLERLRSSRTAFMNDPDEDELANVKSAVEEYLNKSHGR